jgi:hypothetical protein
VDAAISTRENKQSDMTYTVGQHTAEAMGRNGASYVYLSSSAILSVESKLSAMAKQQAQMLTTSFPSQKAQTHQRTYKEPVMPATHGRQRKKMADLATQ